MSYFDKIWDLFNTKNSKNNNSIKLCLKYLSDLQNFLEELGKLSKNTFDKCSTENHKLLLKIKEIIIKINFEKNDIILSGKLLKKILNESLELFNRLHDINEDANKPHSISVELLQLWGYKNLRTFESNSNIILIQKFLRCRIYKRIYYSLI